MAYAIQNRHEYNETGLHYKMVYTGNGIFGLFRAGYIIADKVGCKYCGRDKDNFLHQRLRPDRP